jgi:hypothetical protein
MLNTWQSPDTPLSGRWTPPLACSSPSRPPLPRTPAHRHSAPRTYLTAAQQNRLYTDKKENEIFLIYNEIQMGSVAKSEMRMGFLIIYMRKYLTIYEEAVSHKWLCNRSLLTSFDFSLVPAQTNSREISKKSRGIHLSRNFQEQWYIY